MDPLLKLLKENAALSAAQLAPMLNLSEAEVAKNRAAGTHVENIRNVTELTDDDLRAEAKRILDGEGAADGSVSRSTH